MAKTYRWSKSDLEELEVSEINYLLQKIEIEQKELQAKYRK